MTHDSDDESNDPYKVCWYNYALGNHTTATDLLKIDINLEDDEDNHRKRFFETGLGALLDNPHFLLLHVPEDGSKMQIVQPCSDLYHRKRMIKRINEERKIPSFYYALSHLWGISKENRHLWYGIGDYVDDEDGQGAKPISMRFEKRNTLIALLKSHPDSYWWIDVLCARTETPLDIMGDIYACCLGCYSMIDCEPAIITQLYTKRIESKELDDPAFKFETMRDPEFLMPYEQYYVKECPQIIDPLSSLISSEWWKRVWTWQEMALPTNVYLLAETTSYICHQQTIILDEITQLNAIMHTLYGFFKETKRSGYTFMEWGAHVISARGCNNARIERKKEAFAVFMLMRYLGSSHRRCMDPVDYVYGILGLFQLKIPRMTDPNAVWKRFLFELQSYLADIKNESFTTRDLQGSIYVNSPPKKILGIDERALQVNLLTAGNMADVYKYLIKIGIVCDIQEWYMDKV